MSPSLTRASAYTLSLAPIIALALVLVTLLPSDSRAAGSVTLVNDTFNCSSYPQPVDFDLVKVTIDGESAILAAGDVVFVPRDAVRRVEVVGNVPASSLHAVYRTHPI